MPTEVAVATTWLIRGGILLLLAALGFFIKYSYEHQLISPELRLIILGCLCICISSYGYYLMKGNYRALGFALCGGGLAGIYLDLFAATDLYHLLHPGVALAGLVAVTLVGILLAVRRSSLPLAFFAVGGGYLAPILLSSQQPNYPFFLAYLAILSIHVLLVAAWKNWHILKLEALLATWILFCNCPANQLPMLLFYGSACLYFFIFVELILVYHYRHKLAISWLELILQGLNIAFFTMRILPPLYQQQGHMAAGCAAGLTGLYYLSHWKLSRRFCPDDRNLHASALGGAITMMFIGIYLISPVEYRPIAMSLSAFAGYCLGRKIAFPFLCIISWISLGLSGMQLLSGRFVIYPLPPNSLPALAPFPLRLANFAVVISTVSGFAQVLRKEELINWDGKTPIWRASLLYHAGLALLIIFGFSELGKLGTDAKQLASVWAIARIVIILGAIVLLSLLGKRHADDPIAGHSAFALLPFLILVITMYLTGSHSLQELPYRILVVLLCCLLLGGSARILKKSHFSQYFIIFHHTAAWGWLLYSTLECYDAIRISLASVTLASICVSLLWTSYAILLLGYGLYRDLRIYRKIGLTLFAAATLLLSGTLLYRDELLMRFLGCLVLGLALLGSAWGYTRFSIKQNHNKGQGTPPGSILPN